MTTNPLLARRDIRGKERLQKALVALAVTVIAVGAAWLLSGASPDISITHMAAIAALGVAGLLVTAYLGLKRHESGLDKEDKQRIRERIADDRSDRSWFSRIGYNSRRLIFGLVVWTGALLVIAGVGVLAYQAYGYLKTGDWTSLSLLGIAWPYLDWLRNPGSWFGLHRITTQFLQIVPASVALFILGFLVAGIGSALRGRVRRKL